MPWIESHTEIERHRKCLLMAEALGIKPVHLSGHLHALWHTMLEQQEDGDLSQWPVGLISDSAQWEGDPTVFVDALRRFGWLDGDLLHGWLEYTGKYLTAKYRTSNPKKLKEIYKLHKSDSSQTQVGSKSAHLPTNLDKITDRPILDRSKSVRKQSYPLGFEVSQEITEWAVKESLPDPATLLDAFRDYHVAHGSVFKDWNAALRTWTRNAKRFGNGNGRSDKETAMREKTARALRQGL